MKKLGERFYDSVIDLYLSEELFKSKQETKK